MTGSCGDYTFNLPRNWQAFPEVIILFHTPTQQHTGTELHGFQNVVVVCVCAHACVFGSLLSRLASQCSHLSLLGFGWRAPLICLISNNVEHLPLCLFSICELCCCWQRVCAKIFAHGLQLLTVFLQTLRALYVFQLSGCHQCVIDRCPFLVFGLSFHSLGGVFQII